MDLQEAPAVGRAVTVLLASGERVPATVEASLPRGHRLVGLGARDLMAAPPRALEWPVDGTLRRRRVVLTGVHGNKATVEHLGPVTVAERRRHERVAARVPVVLRRPDQAPLLTETSDVSAGGVAGAGRLPGAPGDRCGVELALEAGEPTIRARGEVVGAHGLELVSIDEGDRRRIARWTRRVATSA